MTPGALQTSSTCDEAGALLAPTADSTKIAQSATRRPFPRPFTVHPPQWHDPWGGTYRERLPPTLRKPERLGRRDLDQQLARVRSRVEVDERLGRGFETVANVLAVLQRPVHDHRDQLGHRL